MNTKHKKSTVVLDVTQRSVLYGTVLAEHATVKNCHSHANVATIRTVRTKNLERI